MSRTRLALAALILGVLALLPKPLLGPVTYLHNPLTFLLAPVQQPARSLVVWLRGSKSPEDEQAKIDLREAIRQRDEYHRSFLAAQREIEELHRLVHDVARMSELNSAPVRLVVAPIIGAGADLSGGVLTVRAGRKDGVEKNSAAVVRGVHLVGRVQRADDRTCAVLPITEKAFPKFNARIMLDDKTPGPRCTLKAVGGGDGLLSGQVWTISESAPPPDSPLRASATTAIGAEPNITEGMTVRLDDDSWSGGDQMLIVGKVERVEPSPTQMQRKIVYIRPTEDLTRLSEVMIRIADAQPSSPTSKSAEGKAKP